MNGSQPPTPMNCWNIRNALEALAGPSLAEGRPTMLSELSTDALDAVAQHLSLKQLGRLVKTCRAMAVEATPRHPSWALARADVHIGGWSWACTLAVDRGDLQAMRWVVARGHDLESASSGGPKGGHCYYAAINGRVEVMQWL